MYNYIFIYIHIFMNPAEAAVPLLAEPARKEEFVNYIKYIYLYIYIYIYTYIYKPSRSSCTAPCRTSKEESLLIILNIYIYIFIYIYSYEAQLLSNYIYV